MGQKVRTWARLHYAAGRRIIQACCVTGGPKDAGVTYWDLLRIALVVLLLTVLAISFLYAFRAQQAPGEYVPFGQVLTELQEGRVRSVVIEGHRATVALADGRIQQTTTPGDDQLTRAVLDRNRADPAHPIAMRYQPFTADFGWVMAIGVGVLPLLILIALILLAASLLRRSTAPHRYESLSRLADLRDRGVITEEEFQREKRRLLR